MVNKEEEKKKCWHIGDHGEGGIQLWFRSSRAREIRKMMNKEVGETFGLHPLHPSPCLPS